MVTGRPHGISRYVTRLAEGLAKIEEREPLPYAPVFIRAPATHAAEFAGFETVPLDVAFLSPFELVRVPIAVRRARGAAFHSPSFASFPGLGCPWIATLHDLNHLR